MRARFLFVLGLLALTGCSSYQSPSTLSQAQLNAIESRQVDADMPHTFRAASSALLDAGYTISMSDKEGGLLTGVKETDRTAERVWIAPWIKDTKSVMTIQMQPIDTSKTEIRVKPSVQGEAVVDKKSVDQIWVLMQRQVMMKEPPPAEDATAKASK